MKKIISFLLVVVWCSSCASLFSVPEKQVQLLELGMTKQQVVKIMGQGYVVESVVSVPEGTLEVLHFDFYNTTTISYLMYFLNNKLTEFHRYIPAPPTHSYNNTPHSS